MMILSGPVVIISIDEEQYKYRMFPKKNMPLLCGCYGGAVCSVILDSRHLHRSGLDLEFETLYESI